MILLLHVQGCILIVGSFITQYNGQNLDLAFDTTSLIHIESGLVGAYTHNTAPMCEISPYKKNRTKIPKN
jgi:hypothetical protein